jgi:hypothetical protein
MSTVWQKSTSSASWSAVVCDQKQLPAPVIDDDRMRPSISPFSKPVLSSRVSRISAPSSHTSRSLFSTIFVSA